MATKNIIPRNNDEGKIGTNSKRWAEGHFESLSVAGQSLSGGGATALTGLTDVTITSPQNNQLIQYNNSSNMWVNVSLTTDGLSEGSSNLYFTNARSRNSISASTTGHGSLTYNSSTGALAYTGPSDAQIRTAFTNGAGISISGGTISSTITQYADSNARNAISVTDTGGDGSLSYNNTSGVLTYTGPSAAETRAHFSNGTGISISGGQISIGQAVGTTDNVTFNNLVVSNNLTVSGTTTTINTETINLADNTILLNSNYTGSSPSEDCGIEVERGTQTNKTLVWNETTDKWTVGNETFVAGAFEGNLTGNVTGTVSSISNHDTNSLSEGSNNLYFTNTKARNAISVTDSGGDGSLAYNSSTGVLTYTGPSATEVRAHFSAGTGISISGGVISSTGGGGGSGDIESVTAGNGLAGGGTSGAVTLDLDLNELTAADVNVQYDSIAIIDASESNGSRKELISDLMTAVSGNGLASSNGVISVDVDNSSIEINSSAEISTSPQVITVTVVSSGGNKYALDGVTQKVDTLVKGVKYRFDQSDGTNSGHPLAFSTASNGGGSSYTTGVTTVGSPGNSGAYTEIIVPHSAPSTLYYYCTAHSGMGASVQTEVIAGTGLSKTASTISVDASIITGQNEESSAHDDDFILVYDDSASVLKKMTRATFTAGLGGGGGSSTSLQSILTGNTALSTISGVTSGTHVWLVNGSSSTTTITLPNSGITNGTIYHIKNITSNSTYTATVSITSGNIDNLTSQLLSQYDNLTIVATGNGSQWYII